MRQKTMPTAVGLLGYGGLISFSAAYSFDHRGLCQPADGSFVASVYLIRPAD